MQSGGREYKPPGAAFSHGFQGLIADRIALREIGKQHVVANRAHAGAIQLVEQIRMPLSAPWPAALATSAEMFDRALVDFNHDHAARRLWLKRSPLHHPIEDRIFSRVE